MAETIREELARWLYKHADVGTPIVDEVTETLSERPWEWLTATSREHYSAKADELLGSAVVARIRAEAWDQGARWAAVECDALKTEHAVFIAAGDNPYRDGVTE